MEKFLLFTTGGGSADPLNWSSDEAALYSTSELKGMKPASSRSIDLFFETTYGKEIVTLGIKNSTHAACMRSIATALNSNQVVIPIADVDGGQFCSPYIYSVSLSSQETYCQSITNDDKNKISVARSNYSSCMVANTHSGTVTLDLYLASSVGTDITDTGANVNNGSNYAAGATSVAADGTTPTEDTFLNERVYKEDGTFIGICTAVHATGTPLTFAAGLEVDVLDDVSLYRGTRYTLIKTASIPTASTLKLESSEILFDDSTFDLYAKSSNAGGLLTFTFNY